MTVSLLGTQRVDAGSVGLTIPEGTVAIALVPRPYQVYHGDGYGSNPSLGGVAFTRYESNTFAFCGDISGRSNDTLTADAPVSYVWYIGGNAPAYWESSLALNTTCTAPTNGGNVVGFWFTNGYAGDPAPYYDTVVYSESVGAGWEVAGTAGPGAKNAAVRAGSTNDWAYFSSHGSLFIYESDPSIRFEPVPLGINFGIQAGVTITIPTDVVLPIGPIGVEFGVTPGVTLDVRSGQRQIPIIGGGLFMPDRTQGGTEGQVLTQHDDAPPSWEDPDTSGVLDIIDLPTAEGDTSLVLAPDGAGGVRWSAPTYNGLSDVDVTDVHDLDGMRWDDASNTWLPEHFTTLDEVIELITPTWYSCDSLTVNTGTLEAGAHTDLHAMGGTLVNVSEATGTPGIDAVLAWSGITAFNSWHVNGRYQGSASHHVHIQLYNYDTSAWVTVETMDTSTGNHEYGGLLADGDPYVSGAGAVQMRFYHDDAGNITHDVYLDHVVIGQTAGGVAGPSGIEVAETDGFPDVSGVTRIEFSGATVTNDGAGQVTVTVAGGGGVEGFWQDAEPTPTQDASLWYDTDDSDSYIVGGATPLPSARATRTSGNLTLNSTSWANVDTGLDLVVPAQVGDRLFMTLSGLMASAANVVGLDVVTVVSGSPVNSVSGQNGASDYGFIFLNASEQNIGQSISYVVQSGDISGGNVTLRLRYRTSSAADHVLYAGSAGNPMFTWSVVNLRAIASMAVIGGASGTAFPVSPTSGMRFFRTDIRGGVWFRWNASISRWLSEQEYTLGYGGVYYSGSFSEYRPLPHDYPIHLTRVDYSFYGSSESWTVKIRVGEFDETYTDVPDSTQSTSGHTDARWYGYSLALSYAVDGTTGNSGNTVNTLVMDAARSSGTTYIAAIVSWRLSLPAA